jgi:hypothetical protein
MKRINLVIYALFGIGAVAYGVATLVSPRLLVSEAGQSVHLTHIMREQGAAAIFIGLMAFWCLFNYESRRVVHYFLMLFVFLLAVIHWYDYLAGNIGWMSPTYNSLPFLALLLMAMFSRRDSSTYVIGSRPA